VPVVLIQRLDRQSVSATHLLLFSSKHNPWMQKPLLQSTFSVPQGAPSAILHAPVPTLQTLVVLQSPFCAQLVHFPVEHKIEAHSTSSAHIAPMGRRQSPPPHALLLHSLLIVHG
jgi:hypothetical protein